MSDREFKAPDEAAKDRPQILVAPGERDRLVREATAALSADPDLYQRSNALVFLTRTTA